MLGSLRTNLSWAAPAAAAWICTVGLPVHAYAQSAEEMSMVRGWAEANLGPKAAAPPFSFMYGGEPSVALLKGWKTQRSSKQLERGRTQQTTTYTDPKTGLDVRCVAVVYDGFPTVEWTVYLKNTGTADAPFIDNLNASILCRSGPPLANSSSATASVRGLAPPRTPSTRPGSHRA